MNATPAPQLRLEWWLVALTMTVAAMLSSMNNLTERFDDILYDTVSQWNSAPADPRILIVAIDERSLAEFGQWPWPRSLDARLIDEIQQARPTAIAFDALLIESKDGDELLARAMHDGAPVYLPLAFETPGRGGKKYELVLPPPPLSEGARAVGHVNLVAGPDGIVRRARLWDGDPGEAVPHLMVELARMSLRAEAKFRDERSIKPRLVPLAGPPGTYSTISAAAILNGEFPSNLAQDRILLIGATASGLSDWHPTAISQGNGMMSGVEFQANLLDAILNDRLISDASPLQRIILSALPLWLLLISFRRYTPRTVIIVMTTLSLATLTISSFGLLALRTWLPPATTLAILIVAYFLWGWRRLSVLHDFLAREVEQLDAGTHGNPSPAPLDRTSRQAALLRNAIETMRQSQRQRERILQFLSHDMRTPQSLILSVIKSSSSGEISPDLAERVSAYASRTLELADNFVGLARAESDSFRLELLDLVDILNEAADHLWPLFQSKRLGIELPQEEVVRLVSGDGSMLFRVFINLLHNAYKHSPEGGVIRCELHEEEAPDSSPRIILSVEDQGPGVSPERQKSLFDPFAADDGHGRKHESVGLGLAFVSTVVHRHGGTVWYEPGKGARFLLALPLHSTEMSF